MTEPNPAAMTEERLSQHRLWTSTLHGCCACCDEAQGVALELLAEVERLRWELSRHAECDCCAIENEEAARKENEACAKALDAKAEEYEAAIEGQEEYLGKGHSFAARTADTYRRAAAVIRARREQPT